MDVNESKRQRILTGVLMVIAFSIPFVLALVLVVTVTRGGH